LLDLYFKSIFKKGYILSKNDNPCKPIVCFILSNQGFNVTENRFPWGDSCFYPFLHDVVAVEVMIAFVAPKKRKPTTPAIDVKINCPVFA
jgi:hypothetical protein